jgi:hypothetical protein
MQQSRQQRRASQPHCRGQVQEQYTRVAMQGRGPSSMLTLSQEVYLDLLPCCGTGAPTAVCRGRACLLLSEVVERVLLSATGT